MRKERGGKQERKKDDDRDRGKYMEKTVLAIAESEKKESSQAEKKSLCDHEEKN